MSENAGKSRYLGRVEVFAAREEIKALLEAGYSYAMIFEKLTREKRLSISYRQFCRCLVQYCGVKVRVQKNSPTVTAATSQAESRPRPSPGIGPQIVGGTKKTFQKDIIPDEELF